ncbi:MAG: hypothetical protein SNJ59_13245 [Aggregatilineales bacterium]
MQARLERTLIAIARRYAPPLVPENWRSAGDYRGSLPTLARALASYNVLVLLGDLPDALAHQAPVQFKAWADAYIALYTRLSETLFPSYTQASAYYADQDWPPIVIVYGAATPVIVVLAGYVAPYAAARHGTKPADVELLGMADEILDALEADDLPRAEYRRLRADLVEALRGLLALKVRPIALTRPERPLFDLPEEVAPAAPPPQSLPEAPAPPVSLPEDAPMMAPQPVHRPGTVPIFFDSRRPHRRPPVPDLPEFPPNKPPSNAQP